MFVFFSQTSPRPLPSFATDFSEVAISAVIERGALSENELQLSVFMVGHKAFSYRPQMPFLAINASTSLTTAKWRKVAEKWRGRESSPPEICFCRFRHSPKSASYIVQGTFVPSNTSIDPGFNRMLEVLRCPLDYTAFKKSFILHTQSKRRAKLEVEIFRMNSHRSVNRSETSLFTFYVPWRSRQSGWGFRPNSYHSGIDPWAVYTRRTDNPSPEPTIHLCSPVIRPLEPHRKDPGLSMLLEFIEHNVHIGIAHQFFGVFLDSASFEFQQLLRLFDPYIRSGAISIKSVAIRGYNDAAGFLGLLLIDDYVRMILDQQCLYFSKGMVDYVMLAHAAEFITLMPQLPAFPTPPRLPEYLHRREQDSDSGSGSAFLSACAYIVQAYGVPDPDSDYKRGPGDGIWTKDFFRASKAIGPLPAWPVLIVQTACTWLVAWHVIGACKKHNRSVDAQITQNDYNTFPIEHIVSYFYRGHFEPWQLSKPVQPINYHLKLYSHVITERLREKGYSLERGQPQLVNELGEIDLAIGKFDLPLGKASLLHTGWIECSNNCKTFMDILF